MDLSAERLTRILKWDKTGRQIQNLLEQNGFTHISYVVSREYQLSSALSFYLPGQIHGHIVSKSPSVIYGAR